MHEYSLMEDILESVTSDLKTRGIDNPASVKEVIVRVGALDIHSEESFLQAFEAIAKGTVLRSAKLTLHVTPTRIECLRCGYSGDCHEELDGHNPNPMVECPGCGAASAAVGGRGVEPVELVLDD